MNIAFDIDGVLTNIADFQLTYGKQFFKEKYNKDIVNPAGADIKEIFQCTEEEFHDFWAKYLIPYAISCPPREGFVDLIHHLQVEGNNISIITSRVYGTDKGMKGKIMRSIVKAWLKHWNIAIDEDAIFFCDEDKKTICKQNNIDVIFEDTPENINNLKECTNVICMTNPYNKMIKKEDHVEVIEDALQGYEAVLKFYLKEQQKDVIGPWSGKLSIDKPWIYLQKRLRMARETEAKDVNKNMFQFIVESNKKNLDGIAFTYYKNEITYQEFFEKVKDAEKSFREMGIKAKDIVPVIMPNTPEALYMFYALVNIGAVPAMIHPKSSEGEITKYINTLITDNEEYQYRGVIVCISNYSYKLTDIQEDIKANTIINVSPTESMPKTKRKLLQVALDLKEKTEKTILKIETKDNNNKIVVASNGDLCSARIGNLVVSRLLKILPEEFDRILSNLTSETVSLVKRRYTKKTINGLEYYIHNSQLINKISWKEFLQKGKNRKIEDKPYYQKDALAVILYTGGTSGAYSKAVAHSNENFNNVAIQSEDAIFQFHKGEKTEGIVPIFHGFGLGSNIHAQLGAGMNINLIPSPHSNTVKKQLSKNHSQHIIGIPVILPSLIENKKFSLKKEATSVKTVSVGGDVTKENLESKTNEWLFLNGSNARIKKGYGLTECITAAAYSFDYMNKEYAIGLPMLGNTIKIVDPNTMEEVEPGCIGEICVSGPTLMLGYFNNPEETNRVLRLHEDGKTYLHTGDAGYMDSMGYLYFSHRMKDMIVSSGYNIYPSQVEETIESHNAVESCVTIAEHHPYKNEVPKCYIVLKEGYSNISEISDEIKALCRKNLAEYAQPYEFEFVKDDYIPRTKFGKINRNKLKEMNEKKSINENRETTTISGKEEKKETEKKKVLCLFEKRRIA